MTFQDGTDGAQRVLERNEKWKSDVDYIIVQLAKKGVPFTANEVRAAAQNCGLPEPSHPNAWGGALMSASKRKLVKRVGYRRSEGAARHGGVVAEWAAY